MTDATADIAYFRKQLFAALKIPEYYVGGEDSLASTKAAVAAMDEQLARDILKPSQKKILEALQREEAQPRPAAGSYGHLIEAGKKFENPDGLRVEIVEVKGDRVAWLFITASFISGSKDPALKNWQIYELLQYLDVGCFEEASAVLPTTFSTPRRNPAYNVNAGRVRQP